MSINSGLARPLTHDLVFNVPVVISALKCNLISSFSLRRFYFLVIWDFLIPYYRVSLFSNC